MRSNIWSRRHYIEEFVRAVQLMLNLLRKQFFRDYFLLFFCQQDSINYLQANICNEIVTLAFCCFIAEVLKQLKIVKETL